MRIWRNLGTKSKPPIPSTDWPRFCRSSFETRWQKRTIEVYITDGYGNRRVVVFDRNGNFLRQFGRQATRPRARLAWAACSWGLCTAWFWQTTAFCTSLTGTASASRFSIRWATSRRTSLLKEGEQTFRATGDRGGSSSHGTKPRNTCTSPTA
jgi:hypothetical protein